MLAPAQLLQSRGAGRAAAVLLALIVVTSGALARRAAVGPDDQITAIAHASLPEALVGIVQPSDISTVSTPVALTIAEVMATVGDELGPGDPIARLDLGQTGRELEPLQLEVERASQDVADRERGVRWLAEAIQRLEGDAANAGAQLALAEREAQQVPVRQTKDSPERAQVAYEQAVLRARRAEQLAEHGLIAKQDVEDAQFGVRLAADDLAVARQAEEAARRLRTAQTAQAAAGRELSLAAQRRELAEQQAGLEQLRLALRQAQLKYETARVETSEPFVRSPRRGAVLELPIHAGDRLAAGSLVATIASLDPIAVDVDVAPMFVRALRVGGTARVDVPSIGAAGREARIRSISPVPGDSGQYAVRLLVSNPPRARLLAGQTAYATFAAADRR